MSAAGGVGLLLVGSILAHSNHLSEVIHINTGGELLGREILDFIAEGARRQQERARAR